MSSAFAHRHSASVRSADEILHEARLADAGFPFDHQR
jgi:hypothetical protein